MCMSASARVCYSRISPLIVCEGSRSETEALAAGTPRIQATPSSTTLSGAQLRGLAGRRERRGVRGVNATQRRRGEHKREDKQRGDEGVEETLPMPFTTDKSCF